jgi:hypothetical protein
MRVKLRARIGGRGLLSRLVRRSPEAAFALRATARPQYEGRAIAKRRAKERGTH